MKKFLLIPLALTLGLLLTNSVFATATNDATWHTKVSPSLSQKLSQEQPIGGFLVMMTAQADVSGAADLPTKEEKGQFVYDQLTAIASTTQISLTQLLDDRAIPYQTYWIANMVWVHDSSLELVEELALRDDVGFVYDNESYRNTVESSQTRSAQPPSNVAWGVAQINAPAVWDMGITGEGAVVGGLDTGIDWTHNALVNQYRGSQDDTVDHNYNWHDAIHGQHWLHINADNPCGFSIVAPCDDGTHGTFTLGVIIGNDMEKTTEGWPSAAPNAIGVAPGAQWIGCRNMERGWGSPSTYSECYEWSVAPTDSNGENADISKAPHVINNSWGCPAVEGCSSPEIMERVVDNVRASGIVVVSSAGNDGSSECSTSVDPSAIYDSAFSIGATTQTDEIARFSSTGPIMVDESGRLKPDLVAPGQGIRSSRPNNTYGSANGTSAAAPHVAGVVALMISANPNLAGHVDQIEKIMRETAVPLTTELVCDGFEDGSQIPNVVYGFGRVDAEAAVQASLDLISATNVDMSQQATTYPQTATYLPLLFASLVVTITGSLTLIE